MSRRRAENKLIAVVPNVEAGTVAVSPRTQEMLAMPKAELSPRDRHAEARAVAFFVAGQFCEAHERLGSDSEVVMLEQVSEGMRGPCVTIPNGNATK